MISKKLQKGRSINASKPVRVLNRLAGSGTMLAWYQDKPVEVLNRPVGSGTLLAWYQDKPIGVLNRPTGSMEISGKRDLVNAPLGTWFNSKICLGLFFMMSLKNNCKMDSDLKN